MKIIKMGNRLKLAYTYKLKCKHCGCIFTFDKEEVIVREKCLMGSSYIKCPCCGIIIDFKSIDCVIRIKGEEA